MAIQFGTVDGLVNITESTIQCFVKAIHEFSLQGGPVYAKKRGISYGTAFQRFVDPVYSGKSNDFVVNSITTPVYTQGGKEQSPARGTYCKKMGLLEMDESKEIFNITPLGNAILNKELSTKEYALILLSKMGVFKDGVYIDNVFCVLSSYFRSNAIISQSLLEKYIKNRYNVSGLEKTRIDIIVNSMSFAGLITKVKDDLFTVSNTEYALIFNEFLANSPKIRPAIIDNASNYSNYIGSIDYGVFNVLTKENIDIFNKYYPNLSKYMNNSTSANQIFDSTLQQIFYGAPGTGKSNTIKREVDDNGKINFRVTFHPDSDYSTFVGCYKPTMKENIISKNNVEIKEEQIVYRFVPQAFAKAYTTAWNTEEDVFLIIEEINRGNCAQIFGDLFQLLDRGNDGFSEYPVDADTDLGNYIAKGLADSTRKDFPVGVKEGKKLVLPKNLYIWATMNTSDQSLFPIDSAFKRRWGWKYMKIKNEGKKWKIDVKIKDADGVENLVDWWIFIQKINEIIASMTSSADKQLGYFFCKADKKTSERESEPNSENNLISDDKFVSKVLFYLWNDVFKDYGFEDSSLFTFKEQINGTEETKELTFPDFYDEDGEKVNTKRLTDFVQKVMDWKKSADTKDNQD